MILTSDLYIGSWVVLGQHNDNQYWDSFMSEFVGKETIIIGGFRRDPFDKHVCKVSIDGGRSRWRTENMKLVSHDVGKLKVGSKVIVGSHDWILVGVAGYLRNWRPEKEKYVGKEAYITRLCGQDASMARTCRIDIDGGIYSWRLVSLTPTD
jgi:hypothetical protein